MPLTVKSSNAIPQLAGAITEPDQLAWYDSSKRKVAVAPALDGSSATVVHLVNLLRQGTTYLTRRFGNLDRVRAAFAFHGLLPHST
jgi:hypothetical protein